MPRQSLLEYFQHDSRPPNEIAVVWRRGYRRIRWSYAELFGAAAHFSSELADRGLRKGDRVLLWGENSGEWVAAFLGCLLRGAVSVPMDAIADKGFARRVARAGRCAARDSGARPVGAPAVPATLTFEEFLGSASEPSGETLSPVPAGRERSG